MSSVGLKAKTGCRMSNSIDERAVAVLDYHDGSAGQVETWFQEVTGDHIACFVHESPTQPTVNVEAEHRKRVSKLTEFPQNGEFKGRPLIAATNWVEELLRRGIRKVLPLTPDNQTRLRQIAICRAHGIQLVSAIHPSVVVLPKAIIQPGVWINAGSIIGYKAEIASGVLINTGVQIDHHNVLEECCQIDPAVVTAGNATFRRCSHIHTGAIVVNRVEIGEDAVVGAGSLVLNDLPARTVAWGVPARVVRTTN